ncbi:UNVERIFIED_CONTAM: hypothetical protein HDU68_007196 [Siphonaria sp. JEL0065]|nr:hypothetical protein HDU68_007196 [Siphonaria sp. JEL0065]
MFWMSWKLLKGGIDALTVKKIEIRDNPETLIGIIDRDQLFERYGGLVKDMYDAIPVAHDHEPAGASLTESSNPLFACDDAASHGSSILTASPTVETGHTAEAANNQTVTPGSTTNIAPDENPSIEAEVVPSLQVETVEYPSQNTSAPGCTPSPTSVTSATSATTSNTEPPKKSFFSSWKFTSQKSVIDNNVTVVASQTANTAAPATPHPSPEVSTPPKIVVAPKGPTLAVPPLSPLTVEVLWCAPEFDEGVTAIENPQQIVSE